MTAKPKRPYLLRALLDWIVDSDLTPYLLVGVDSEAVQVPMEYVSEGKIVLNISSIAVRDLHIGSDAVSFSGRFSGQAFPVYVPMDNVIAIYAKETGEGMAFDPEDSPEPEPDPDGTDTPPGGHLKVVK
jgi:stringent starvation protein B